MAGPVSKYPCPHILTKGVREGEPCGRPRVKDPGNPGEYKATCVSHLPVEERHARGLHLPGVGRPRKPRPTDVERELVESSVVAVLAPYWRVLGFDVVIGDDGPKLVERPGGGAKISATHKGVVIVSDHDDLAAQIDAAEKIRDRVYGRSKQTAEISGPDGGPVEVIDTTDPKTRQALHALLARRPASSDS